MPHSKYSPKQKKLARVAPPRNKITGADLKKLRAKPKRREGKNNANSYFIKETGKKNTSW